MNVRETVDDILGELIDAERAYPEFHSMHEGMSVLREEVDELWSAVKLAKGQFGGAGDRARARRECVQIAAMALRFIKDCCDAPENV